MKDKNEREEDANYEETEERKSKLKSWGEKEKDRDRESKKWWEREKNNDGMGKRWRWTRRKGIMNGVGDSVAMVMTIPLCLGWVGKVEQRMRKRRSEGEDEMRTKWRRERKREHGDIERAQKGWREVPKGKDKLWYAKGRVGTMYNNMEREGEKERRRGRERGVEE